MSFVLNKPCEFTNRKKSSKKQSGCFGGEKRIAKQSFAKPHTLNDDVRV